MIINVSPELLTVIEKIEAMEREEINGAEFAWNYDANGLGATGVAIAGFIYKEFEVYVSPNLTVSVTFRELDKWDYDNTETHPLDSDYEADEE